MSSSLHNWTNSVSQLGTCSETSCSSYMVSHTSLSLQEKEIAAVKLGIKLCTTSLTCFIFCGAHCWAISRITVPSQNLIASFYFFFFWHLIIRVIVLLYLIKHTLCVIFEKATHLKVFDLTFLLEAIITFLSLIFKPTETEH